MIIVNNLKWNQLYIEIRYTLRRIFMNYDPTSLLLLALLSYFHCEILENGHELWKGKTHTHNENYTLIPKSILNQWISSLIKFKIYYKKKKLYFKNKLYHILIREKSRHPRKITMQKCQGTSIYNYPLAYHAGNQLVI